MPRDIIITEEFIFEIATDLNGYATAASAAMCQQALFIVGLDA